MNHAGLDPVVSSTAVPAAPDLATRLMDRGVVLGRRLDEPYRVAHRGVWFDRAGQLVGHGGLDNTDASRLKSALHANEVVFILEASNAREEHRWRNRSPKLRTIRRRCSFIITARNFIIVADQLARTSRFHAFKNLLCTVISHDEIVLVSEGGQLRLNVASPVTRRT